METAITRRRFLKRSGGATLATFVAWNISANHSRGTGNPLPGLSDKPLITIKRCYEVLTDVEHPSPPINWQEWLAENAKEVPEGQLGFQELKDLGVTQAIDDGTWVDEDENTVKFSHPDGNPAVIQIGVHKVIREGSKICYIYKKKFWQQ